MKTRAWLSTFAALVVACSNSSDPIKKLQKENQSLRADVEALKKRTEPESDDRRAALDFSNEMTECAAAFGLSAALAGIAPGNDGSDSGGWGMVEKRSADMALKASETAAIYGRRGGQTQATILANVEKNTRDLVAQMNNRTLNASQLLDRYLAPCIKIMEDPAARYEEFRRQQRGPA